MFKNSNSIFGFFILKLDNAGKIIDANYLFIKPETKLENINFNHKKNYLNTILNSNKDNLNFSALVYNSNGSLINSENFENGSPNKSNYNF